MRTRLTAALLGACRACYWAPPGDATRSRACGEASERRGPDATARTAEWQPEENPRASRGQLPSPPPTPEPMPAPTGEGQDGAGSGAGIGAGAFLTGAFLAGAFLAGALRFGAAFFAVFFAAFFGAAFIVFFFLRAGAAFFLLAFLLTFFAMIVLPFDTAVKNPVSPPGGPPCAKLFHDAAPS